MVLTPILPTLILLKVKRRLVVSLDHFLQKEYKVHQASSFLNFIEVTMEVRNPLSTNQDLVIGLIIEVQQVLRMVYSISIIQTQQHQIRLTSTQLYHLSNRILQVQESPYTSMLLSGIHSMITTLKVIHHWVLILSIGVDTSMNYMMTRLVL